MSSSVWVLCPNGHRVNVEVNPNTPLSTIKQQACDKHGFNPANYGLRRENHKVFLDLSFPFRLSGLPNKAKLELVEESQKDVVVNIALQLDTGQRLLGKCLNSCTLKDAIHSIGEEILSVSYVMYLQRKIDNIDFTTLKLSDLGIFKGSALLRLHSVELETGPCSSANTNAIETPSQNESVMETDSTIEKESERTINLSPMEIDKEHEKLEDSGENLQDNDGDQSAPILFNPIKSGLQSSAADPDEDFYEVNDRDLQIMLRDLQKISERQFRFKAPEKEKHIPDKVVFRIRFPNGMMLQNIFNAKVDTTDTLYDFVKSYLTKDSSEHLNIYQGPPKHIIKPGLTLSEAGLTCTSLLHAGGEIILKSDLLVETDPSRAISQLTGVIGGTSNVARKSDDTAVTKEENVIVTKEENAASSSQQNNSSQAEATSNKSGKPVPKWFKMR